MSDLEELLKEAPVLTFDGIPEEKQAPTAKQPVEIPDAKEAMQPELTPEEQKMVDDFAAQIDLANTQMIMQYGAGCQKKIADFSDTALESVRTKDMGEVGEMLTDVVAELREFGEDEDAKGFLGFFKKNANKLSNMKARYDKAEVNVNRISEALEKHQVVLLKDVAMLDKM